MWFHVIPNFVSVGIVSPTLFSPPTPTTVLWQVELGSAWVQLTSGVYSAFPHLCPVGFDRWGLVLVSWTDLPWGCFITPPGARECSSMCLAGGAGEQDCPSVLITKLGKMPLFPHGRALLMRRTVCGLVVTASTWEGMLMLWRSAGEYLHCSCYRFAVCSCSAWMCLTWRGQRIIFLLSFQMFLLI